MSCISNNFSSFFLNSLNDSSEFAKYLSNGELKFSSFEDFQVFGSSAGSSTPPLPPPSAQQASASQQQQYYNGVGNSVNNNNVSAGANTTGVQSGGELFNGVSQTNAVGNCAQNSSEASNASAITPATAPNLAQPGIQQLQHGSHLHVTHHTHPSHVPHSHPHAQHPYGGHAPHPTGSLATNAFHQNHLATPHLPHGLSTPATQSYPTTPQRWSSAVTANPMVTASPGTPHTLPQLHSNNQPGTPIAASPGAAQHFDGSFEFLKYLRHSNDYNSEGQSDAGSHATVQAGQSQSSASSLIDLDSSTTHKSRSSRKAAALLSSVSRASNSLDATTLDVFDHDSKHTIFDMHHITATNSSNSNESSLEVSNLPFPNSHLNASNSNTSSEGAATGSSDFTMLQSGSAASAPKPLAAFTIKDNFDVHPSHKVEEGIFQHMNKLPAKKKENLKQLGVRFTGQMTLADKSIVVENFIKFCQEYDIQDHRPFLSLNQSGLNKADQIKFARYLGQGLPTFTLFCIYSNFKNLFCTKRTEIYTKDGYNLPYILDKTKRFLSNTTAGNASSKSNPCVPQSQPQLLQSQPLQPQPLQSLPLQPQPLQSQPLQPQPLQSQSLQSQPLQPQPLQSQFPKTPQTQSHPQLLLQAPPPQLPPGHFHQLQQQHQQPLHIPMSMSRDLKTMVQQQSNDSMDFGPNTSGSLDSSCASRVGSNFESLPPRCLMPKVLENLIIYENFDVHETHRVEDGVCTHITRLPPKKQEIFKQFGIQSNQTVTFYEKYIIVENFSKFCNEYKISDHRSFLDFHESGLPKCEQVKFVRYLGQGLPSLTLNKIYLSFKDLLGMNRIEKTTSDGYNLDLILKKKRKNLYNRMQAAVHRESGEPVQAIPAQQSSAQTTHLDGFKT